LASAAGTATSTSGTFGYQGTIFSSNPTSVGAWQSIISNNRGTGTYSANNSLGLSGQASTVTGLHNDLVSAMATIKALPFDLIVANFQALNGLISTNDPIDRIVIDVADDALVWTKLTITGTRDQAFFIR
jgi:hypothetical protein